MPPVNHPAVSAGIIVGSVAVAAAIAVYESPELQRLAADLRRRIAIALHSLGDSITPQERENLFNRPEDAEGFLRSRGLLGPEGEPGVDADDETRRRQREEMMYWNAKRDAESREKGEAPADPEKAQTARPRGPSFDDFMHSDSNAEKGTYVLQSGAQHQQNAGELRRRGVIFGGLSHPDASAYTNPFADEYGIESHVAFENSLEDPKDEGSDIYSATDVGRDDRSQTMASAGPSPLKAETPIKSESATPPLVDTRSPEPSQSEQGPFEFATAGQDDPFSSIHAWAHTSNSGLFSPLPETPCEEMSEPEHLSNGELTPTDSASLAGSGVDVANDTNSFYGGSQNMHDDVISDDEGIMTPTSWSDVGSVISENDAQHNGPVPA